jgi:molybdopterin molybdotransferase
MKKNISVEEAREIVLAEAAPTGTEKIPFDEAAGRTLAAPITSREDIPPFRNSARDGFAVRRADFEGEELPITLPRAFEVPAGHAPERAVEPGTVAQIMTGAPVPDGADAVAPIEWTKTDENGKVRFERAPEPHANVREAGEDVREGQTMIEAGTLVTPPVVGMAASLGYPELEVACRPRVAPLSTGDELVPVHAQPGPGQIRDANGPALAAQARHAGARALAPLAIADERAAVRRHFRDALDEADVLLISGGMSMGEYDFVRDVLEEMGMEWCFWKVRQRPGRPLGFGTLEDESGSDTLVFGLPGNPVSSAVCFEQYARPALAKMRGRRRVQRPLHAATLTEAMRSRADLHYFARGIAELDEEGRLTVRSTGAQGSHVYSSMTAANCLIHFPEGLEDPAAGRRVQVEWLEG